MALSDISTNHPQQANRIGNLEDLNPDLFREIDKKISAYNRLLRFNKN